MCVHVSTLLLFLLLSFDSVVLVDDPTPLVQHEDETLHVDVGRLAHPCLDTLGGGDLVVAVPRQAGVGELHAEGVAIPLDSNVVADWDDGHLRARMLPDVQLNRQMGWERECARGGG